MSTATLPEVKLRAPEPTDTDRMYLWENDPEMWRFGYSPAPLSRQQIWEYISNYNADPFTASQLRLMIDSDGETVGTADLYDIDIRHRRAFVGIMIAPAYRRKGNAMAALKALQTYCAENIGLHRILSRRLHPRRPSAALGATKDRRHHRIHRCIYLHARIITIRQTG